MKEQSMLLRGCESVNFLITWAHFATKLGGYSNETARVGPKSKLV